MWGWGGVGAPRSTVSTCERGRKVLFRALEKPYLHVIHSLSLVLETAHVGKPEGREGRTQMFPRRSKETVGSIIYGARFRRLQLFSERETALNLVKPGRSCTGISDQSRPTGVKRDPSKL